MNEKIKEFEDLLVNATCEELRTCFEKILEKIDQEIKLYEQRGEPIPQEISVNKTLIEEMLILIRAEMLDIVKLFMHLNLALQVMIRENFSISESVLQMETFCKQIEDSNSSKII